VNDDGGATRWRLQAEVNGAGQGYDLIEWLMENLPIDDSVEALHLASLLCQYGYFFPVGDAKTLQVKDDSSLYRFQTPYYWPSQNHVPDSTDYAIYLHKKISKNKQKHGLEDTELEGYGQLKKTLASKWDFVTMQADEQLKMAKDRKKGDKIVSESQERAYWRVYRPPPGFTNTLEMPPVPDHSKPPPAGPGSAAALGAEVDYLRLSATRLRIKISQVAESMITHHETYLELDPLMSPVQPSNPWLTDDPTFMELNEPLVECPTERRVRRWAISMEETVSDPTGLQEITLCMKKEFSHENIRFWTAVHQLKKAPLKMVETEVQRIYDEFLRPGAPCEINIDGKTMERTQELLKTPTRFTYDYAAGHIYDLLLKKDCYPRFLRSEHYKNLLLNATNPTSKKRFFTFGAPGKKKISTVTPPNVSQLTVGSSRLGSSDDQSAVSTSAKPDCEPPYRIDEDAGIFLGGPSTPPPVKSPTPAPKPDPAPAAPAAPTTTAAAPAAPTAPAGAAAAASKPNNALSSSSVPAVAATVPGSKAPQPAAAPNSSAASATGASSSSKQAGVESASRAAEAASTTPSSLPSASSNSSSTPGSGPGGRLPSVAEDEDAEEHEAREVGGEKSGSGTAPVADEAGAGGVASPPDGAEETRPTQSGNQDAMEKQGKGLLKDGSQRQSSQESTDETTQTPPKGALEAELANKAGEAEPAEGAAATAAGSEVVPLTLTPPEDADGTEWEQTTAIAPPAAFQDLAAAALAAAAPLATIDESGELNESVDLAAVKPGTGTGSGTGTGAASAQEQSAASAKVGATAEGSGDPVETSGTSPKKAEALAEPEIRHVEASARITRMTSDPGKEEAADAAGEDDENGGEAKKDRPRVEIITMTDSCAQTVETGDSVDYGSVTDKQCEANIPRESGSGKGTRRKEKRVKICDDATRQHSSDAAKKSEEAAGATATAGGGATSSEEARSKHKHTRSSSTEAKRERRESRSKREARKKTSSERRRGRLEEGEGSPKRGDVVVPTSAGPPPQKLDETNVCPWENEEACKIDTPFVKKYVTFSYL